MLATSSASSKENLPSDSSGSDTLPSWMIPTCCASQYKIDFSGLWQSASIRCRSRHASAEEAHGSRVLWHAFDTALRLIRTCPQTKSLLEVRATSQPWWATSRRNRALRIHTVQWGSAAAGRVKQTRQSAAAVSLVRGGDARVRLDPELQRFYGRKLIQKGLEKARVAVARKLGIRL